MIRVVKETVVRSLQAIELLAREARWTRMSDIAAQLEPWKGPVHRVLAQLCEQGWAELDEHTSKYLTLKLFLRGQRWELVRLTVVNERTLARLATVSNDEAVERPLQWGLGRAAVSGACAANAITSVEQLIAELERTRQRGYGLLVEKDEPPGVVALAVPVRSLTDGAVVGTMSIAGPVMRVRPERYGAFYALLEEASAKLGAVWPRRSVGAHPSEAA